jgi:uroporphyrinogen decarboxylase
MPADVPRSHRDFELYFGFEQTFGLPVNTMLSPWFEVREVEVRDGYRYYYDHEGVLVRTPADGHSTIPEHIEYPLKDDGDWEEKFLPRLRLDDPARIAADLEAVADQAIANNEILQIHGGSLLGLPRDWMGFEQICMAIYTNPDLVERAVEQMTSLSCAMLEAALPRVQGKVHWVHFWEDIAFNAGPMISPELFRQLLTPRYKRITDICRKYGVQIISVDCDGKVEPLVEAWMEGGVNTMFPLERNGGSDPVAFRKRWGKDLRLMGGVDKTKMALGGDVIRRELEYLAPLVEEGGYIPFCDHRCPPDVSLEKYREYVKIKRELFGIPSKDEAIRATPAGLP